MSDESPPPSAPGSINWIDMAVGDAEQIRDFYGAVAGWVPQPLSMGEYDDYVMTAPESGKSVAGICHARGTNTGLPTVWLVYITVADLDASLATCRAKGGTVLVEPRGNPGSPRYAVIRDPAGAVAALYANG